MTDLFQRQLPGLLIQLLESIAAIAAVAHHKAKLGSHCPTDGPAPILPPSFESLGSAWVMSVLLALLWITYLLSGKR